MKTLLPLLAGLCLFTSCSQKVEQPTISQLDFSKYTGTWHEIGRLPNRFEKDVVAATATYTARADGGLTVLNQGLKSTGKRTSILGAATQPDPKQPGRLKVRFNPFPANLFAGDYWIIGLTEDYTKAMVGSPKQNYLWLLSKEPQTVQKDFTPFLKTADQLGYDTARVFWNPKRLKTKP